MFLCLCSCLLLLIDEDMLDFTIIDMDVMRRVVKSGVFDALCIGNF